MRYRLDRGAAGEPSGSFVTRDMLGLPSGDTREGYVMQRTSRTLDHTLGGYSIKDVRFDEQTAEGAGMSTVTVTVTGMTCGHCASSIRDEVGDIPGVTAVDVDLATGKVTVDSEHEVGPESIRNAVEEAGYQLAS